jgi:hypothetical protein
LKINVGKLLKFPQREPSVRKGDLEKIVSLEDATKVKLTENVENDGRIQLTNYLQTNAAKRIPNLKAWLIILVGREWKIVEEIPAS